MISLFALGDLIASSSSVSASGATANPQQERLTALRELAAKEQTSAKYWVHVYNNSTAVNDNDAANLPDSSNSDNVLEMAGSDDDIRRQICSRHHIFPPEVLKKLLPHPAEQDGVKPNDRDGDAGTSPSSSWVYRYRFNRKGRCVIQLQPLSVDAGGVREMVLYRHPRTGELFCYDRNCYHVGYPMDGGDIEELPLRCRPRSWNGNRTDDVLVVVNCPLHNRIFDLRTGDLISLMMTDNNSTNESSAEPDDGAGVPEGAESVVSGGPRAGGVPSAKACTQRVHPVRLIAPPPSSEGNAVVMSDHVIVVFDSFAMGGDGSGGRKRRQQVMEVSAGVSVSGRPGGGDGPAAANALPTVVEVGAKLSDKYNGPGSEKEF